MINKIGLQNIRVFKEKQEFNLSPFTILTGTNNSGKSALQKILILLSTGLKKVDGKHVDLDTIHFDKEFVELTGDYASNVTYDSESDQMHFFFGFEDELFGEVEAELIYVRGKNSLSASIRNLIIRKDVDVVIELERYNLKEEILKNINGIEKDDINDETGLPYGVVIDGSELAWRVAIDSIDSSVNYLRELLLKKKNLGNYQERLLLVDNKIRSKKELSIKDLLLKGECEAKNIEFNSDKINDRYDEYADMKTDWYLWDKNKNQELFFCNESKEISGIFSSPYSDVLINTKLADLVLGETDLLSSSGDGHELIKRSLGEANIYTKKDFIEEYKNFELSFFTYCWSSIWTGVANEPNQYDEHVFYVNNFNRCIEPIAEHSERFGENTLSEDKYLNKSVLSKILESNDLVKIDEQGGGMEMFFDAVSHFSKSNKKTQKATKQAKNEFYDRIIYLKNCLFQLSRQLSSDLFAMIEGFQYSLHNSSIKRHVLVADRSNTDSPFLEFGYRYINNDAGIDRAKGFIDKWITEFGIGDSFEIKPITLNEEIVGVSYYLVENGKLFPIGDCGRGINQLLFIILRVISLGRGSLIMLEEPESNMHPALQSKIADMLFDSHKRFNTKFIVETHSEYLIRRLQYLVAHSSSIRLLLPSNNSMDFNENSIVKLQKLLNTKESKPYRLKKLAEKQLISENDISISYLYNPRQVPQGKKQVEPLKINTDGSLDGEFGTGFFDEATNWKFELMRLKNIQKN